MWPEHIRIYYHHRHVLVPVGPVLLLHDPPLIPVSLREEVMNPLHSSHAGVTSMHARASNTVYWPNMRSDLTRKRASVQVVFTTHPATHPHHPCHMNSHPTHSSLSAQTFSRSAVHITWLFVTDIVDGYPSSTLQKTTPST